MRKALGAAALMAAGLLAAGPAAPATAQTTSKEPSAKAETATVKAPETPQEHFAMADTYRKKAAAYRGDAGTHRPRRA